MSASLLDISSYMLKKVHEVDLKMPLVLVGADYPKDKDDFVKFASLLLEPTPSRTRDAKQWYYCEITCYSKHASQRKAENEIGNLNRPYEIAQPYFNLVHQTNYFFGNSCLRFHEARQIYLDLKSLGQNSSPFAQTAPSLNVHCVVIEAKAQISESKGP